MNNPLNIPKLQLPSPPQVPLPEGVPAPVMELGNTGQKTMNQAYRSLNGVLQGGNPIVEMISGVQSAIQNIPLPTEMVAQVRRGMRNARFPFAELQAPGQPAGLPQLPGLPPLGSVPGAGNLAVEPGTPTGNRENPKEIPIL